VPRELRGELPACGYAAVTCRCDGIRRRNFLAFVVSLRCVLLSCAVLCCAVLSCPVLCCEVPMDMASAWDVACGALSSALQKESLAQQAPLISSMSVATRCACVRWSTAALTVVSRAGCRSVCSLQAIIGRSKSSGAPVAVAPSALSTLVALVAYPSADVKVNSAAVLGKIGTGSTDGDMVLVRRAAQLRCRRRRRCVSSSLCELSSSSVACTVRGPRASGDCCVCRPSAARSGSSWGTATSWSSQRPWTA
jgi:hypothetical protein